MLKITLKLEQLIQILNLTHGITQSQEVQFMVLITLSLLLKELTTSGNNSRFMLILIFIKLLILPHLLLLLDLH
jgi:hypothetical protein